MGASIAHSQSAPARPAVPVPPPPTLSAQGIEQINVARAARAEERHARLLALREAMVAGRHAERAALSGELARTSGKRLRKGEAPAAVAVFRQQFIALLTLQPSKPMKAAELARVLDQEVEKSIPSLPETERSAAWLLIAQIREQLLGDPVTSLAAYDRVSAADKSSPRAQEKIDRLSAYVTQSRNR